MDGEAGSPARCRASNLRFEPSAVSPKAKPENPKGFQPSCHPHQSPLKIEDFSGAEPARKRFFLWKMRFSDAKIAPCPPYTPLGTIESSRGLRPSRALRGFFDSLRGGCSKSSPRMPENRLTSANCWRSHIRSPGADTRPGRSAGPPRPAWPASLPTSHPARRPDSPGRTSGDTRS